MNVENLPYRPCVGIMLFNQQGLVFVGERIDSPGAWQMPQGGIDDGEDVEQAAFRELREETGIDSVTILKVCDKKFHYDLPPHLLGKLWRGQYRGQVQTWVAMRFQGDDNDVDLSFDNPPEFRSWRWVNISDLTNLAISFKKDTYSKVIKEFGHLVA